MALTVSKAARMLGLSYQQARKILPMYRTKRGKLYIREKHVLKRLPCSPGTSSITR